MQKTKQKMNNLRHQRLTKQIHKDLSEIFLLINKNHFQGKMISVSEVRLSPDLSIAKIYLSIFPSKNAEKIIEDIENIKNQIRFELGNKIRHQVKKIPELRFQLDLSFDKMEKIDKLLKKDKKKSDEKKDKK